MLQKALPLRGRAFDSAIEKLEGIDCLVLVVGVPLAGAVIDPNLKMQMRSLGSTRSAHLTDNLTFGDPVTFFYQIDTVV